MAAVLWSSAAGAGRWNETFREGSFGAGGKAEVCCGCDCHTGDTVVTKEPDLTSVENWKALEFFERETEVLEQFEQPSIHDCVDALEIENRDSQGTRLFLFQEFVQGAADDDLH